MENKKSISINLIGIIFSTFTSMVGYEIHGNVFYAIVNWIFSPLAWIYWLLTKSVNLNIIEQAFSFFFN